MEEQKKEVLKRNFKGIWIPREIYLDKRLNWTEKILLVEIDSLDGGNGCWASNEYLGKFLNKTSGQIANIIGRLRKLGLIIDRGFDGRKRYISIQENLKAEFRKTLRQSSGKPEHINKDYISFTKVSKPRRDLQIVSLFIKETGLVVDNKEQFNSIVKRNLRAAKLLEGYSDEDIKETIRILKNTEYLKKYTLETVGKYIDEVKSQRQQSNGRKVLKWEKIETPKGIIMRAVYEPEIKI